MCDGTANTKGQDHAGKAHAQRHLPIREEHAHVDFQAYQEQEQNQAQIGHQGQAGHGGGWEDGLLEAGNAHHDGGTKNDAANDFGNDTGLSQLLEGVMEEPAEDDDDSCLGRMLAWLYFHRRAGQGERRVCRFSEMQMDVTWGKEMHAWIMNSTYGCAASYSVGSSPSMIPAWGAARLPDEEAAAALDVDDMMGQQVRDEGAMRCDGMRCGETRRDATRFL